MKKDLVREIISKKIPCIFLSPHFDDAILSCGSLLKQLSGKTDIIIINVFTQAHTGPYTLSARKLLQDSGSYKNAEDLYTERRKEDAIAFKGLDVKIHNLGLEDAIFRRKAHLSFPGRIIAEFDHVYPTYQWHIVKKIASNDPALKVLKEKLTKYASKRVLVFAPFGIGNHVDHRITRKACEAVFSNLVLYSDFPYNARMHEYGDIKNDQEIYHIKPDFKEKNERIRLYKTQIFGLFPDGKIPEREEVYFINKDTLSF